MGKVRAPPRTAVDPAAEAWDRGQDARELVATEGAVYRDRFDQPRAHWAVAIERDARLAFARLLRELDLDVEPPRRGAAPADTPTLSMR